MRDTTQTLPVNADSAGQKKKKGLFGGLGCLGLLIIVILIAVVGGQGGDKDKAAAPSTSSSSAEATSSADTSAPVVEETEAADETTAPEKATEDPTSSSVPTEYKSALSKANSYAKTMHMSKQGVYDQLTSEYGEKFSPEAAQYAVDTMTAD